LVDEIARRLELTSLEFSKIDTLIKSGEATVKVLDTESKLVGVTYAEDRPGVVEKFDRLHEEGVYPDKMF
ncbi:MAG: hypothetical protein K2L26_07155, partial [Duncaniella sp.]|nr:hypothetical protein [Duncaniella sp.]